MSYPKVKHIDYVLSKKYDGFMGRCYRKTDASYKTYGAKGIRVCGEWIKNIDTFREWAKIKLKQLGISEEIFALNPRKYQIDRINPHGHYSPDNCTFSSPTENARNKKHRARRIVISAEGEEILV